MIWQKTEIDASLVRDISERFGTSIILSSIMVRRGIIKPEDVSFFLEDDTRFLHNPFMFSSMEKAVDRILLAIRENQIILIYGDRDVDGITSTVLLVDSLTSLGARVEWAVPMGNDDYGLSVADVDKAAEKNVKLLLTVDCGISNISEINYAKSHGIDVIVVDHHNPQPILPDAFAIINPKVEELGYPFRDLAGCGVAFKLDWALAFAKGDYYRKTVTLINITPMNESFLVEAVSLRNLVPSGRYRENIVPGMGKNHASPLRSFIGESRVFFFSGEEQKKMFAKVFGPEWNTAEFADMQPLLTEHFPSLSGKSLLKIKESSRLGKYSDKPVSEMEMFTSLFVTVILKKENRLFEGCMGRLDLAALGTVADLMPLLNENRIIVKRGLLLVSASSRKGLRELLLKKNLLGKEISAKEIAWQISPLINATGRLGEPDKAVLLLLSTEQEILEKLSEYIYKLNEKRKEIGDVLWNNIQQQAQESFQRTGQKFVIVAGKDVHRGVTGILATKLVNYFKVPACIIAELPEKAVGSMRSIPNFPLTPFLKQFDGIFTDYGGHDMAAGFNLPPASLPEFLERFYRAVSDLSPQEEKEEAICIDAEIPQRYLTQELYEVVEKLMPFGEANPMALFYTPNLLVESCDVVGKKEQQHLKLLIASEKCKFPAMLWNGVDLYKTRFSVGERVDLVYYMKKNVFMNSETLQLIITDIARAGEKKLVYARKLSDRFDAKSLAIH